MLRFLTSGESHGKAETAILEGLPAGLEITVEDIQMDLEKRRGGAGRGGRGIIEKDRVEILSGVRHGKTLGSPIALIVENADFANWKEKMQPEPIAKFEGGSMDSFKVEEVTNPRPGHADLPGVQKYGFSDIRNVLERASARETIMRVAIGAILRKFLKEFGILIASHTIQIGAIKLDKKNYAFEDIGTSFDKSPEIRCIDEKTSLKMKSEIDKARLEKNTLGGVVEIVAKNVPVGLGSYVNWDRKIDGRIALALMSIPSVKAVEIGSGIEIAGLHGSVVHDEIVFKNGYLRNTNNAGGIEGGMTNGELLVCRVYHKPISTLGNPLNTVDIKSKKEVKALIERSDICVVPRAGIISESMLAFCLADAFLEKFGSDNIDDIGLNYENYVKRLKK